MAMPARRQVFADIPEALLTHKAQEATLEGSLLPPMMVGKILRWCKAAVQVCTPAAHTGGGVDSATIPPGSRPECSGGAAVTPPLKRKLENIIAQHDDET